MKNKKKQKVSENSDSNADDNLHSSYLNVNCDKKNNSNWKDKLFPDQTAIGEILNEEFDCDDPPAINIKVEENSGNKSSNEKTEKETLNQEYNENSSKEKLNSFKSIFNVNELTSDDEIYLFQCPENCTKQDLCNKNFDLTKSKQSIMSNGEVYKVELLNSEKKFITLAVPRKSNTGSLVKLPFKGHIIIQKDIKVVPLESENRKVSDLHTVVFPSDIKIRHPLLGAEWKSYIKLANKAIKKSKSMKTKTKKIMESKNQENVEVKIKKLKRENSHSEIVVHKKKKKHDL